MREDGGAAEAAGFAGPGCGECVVLGLCSCLAGAGQVTPGPTLGQHPLFGPSHGLNCARSIQLQAAELLWDKKFRSLPPSSADIRLNEYWLGQTMKTLYSLKDWIFF